MKPIRRDLFHIYKWKWNLNPLGTFENSYEKNFYNDYKLIFKNGFGGNREKFHTSPSYVICCLLYVLDILVKS